MSREDETETIRLDDIEDRGPRRRAEDRIPAAYKLYFQKMLDQLQPSQALLDSFREMLKENSEVTVHKMNSKMQAVMGEAHIVNESRFKEIEAKIAILDKFQSIEVAKVQQTGRILYIGMGFMVALIAGAFALLK